jgi:hypothetical protein
MKSLPNHPLLEFSERAYEQTAINKDHCGTKSLAGLYSGVIIEPLSLCLFASAGECRRFLLRKMLEQCGAFSLATNQAEALTIAQSARKHRAEEDSMKGIACE